MYCFYFVSSGYSLRDAVHLLPDFKPSFSMLSVANTVKRFHPVLKNAYSDTLPEH